MTNYDVFNGDADGLCALTQLRNAQPRDAQLITGVKRDIKLLDKISPEPGSLITVLDVSLDKNRAGLGRLLCAGAEVFYCDHHFPGDIPEHSNLQAIINTAPNVCTSLLINQYLEGAFMAWAVVGTFGDNLKDSARALARPMDVGQEDLDILENLGVYINYNGYGSKLEDLHFEPANLYRLISTYTNPFDFVDDGREYYELLETAYRQDMAAASAVLPEHEDKATAAYMLPNESWARRVSGVYSNDLANAHPERAHAVLSMNSEGGYLVSVRAPLSNKTGADQLCMKFPTGGGRKAAAGINNLPAEHLAQFIDTFAAFYRQ